jgi:pilus assembly protein Flp/PilA
MTEIRRRLTALVRDQRGQDLIEYALLASLIAVVTITAVSQAGNEVGSLWATVASGLKDAWK